MAHTFYLYGMFINMNVHCIFLDNKLVFVTHVYNNEGMYFIKYTILMIDKIII